MKLPLVSVLLPLYNGESRIAKTLESIKAQTYKNYELVVIDDGCTDNSISIVKEIFPESVVIRQENSGITVALNEGSKYCNGKYISRIDCGDIASTEWIEKHSDFLEKHPETGVVGGDILYFSEEEGVIGTVKHPIKKKDIQNALIFGNHVITHSGATIRKSKLIEAGYYDEFYNGKEDFELWRRMALISEINNIEYVIMKVLVTTNGISYKTSKMTFLVEAALIENQERKEKGIRWKNEELRKSCIEKMNNFSIPDQFSEPRVKAIFLCKRAGAIYLSGERRNSLKQYLKAVKSDFKYYRSWIGIISAIFVPLFIYRRVVMLIKIVTGKKVIL